MQISPAAWEEVRSHALDTYPEECCGALLGKGQHIQAAVRLQNSSARDRRTHFEVRPEELLEATVHARDLRLEILGIYHSHPDRDAYFSGEDLSGSCPWYYHLVVSVAAGVCGQAKCYRAESSQTGAVEMALLIPPTSASPPR